MTIFQAVLLGIVQGFSEFLPVSSSGHLVLLQNLFGINEAALFFDTMLHLGTLVPVVAIYFTDLIDIFRKGVWKRLFMLIIASIPAAAAGFFFQDFFEEMYGGARLLGFGFLFTAIVLALSDRISVGKKDLNRMRLWDALGMGVMQGIAIFPGVSRSGSTISGGIFSGLNRRFAADFSFQMSIPIILGSVILQGKDALEAGFANVDWTPILIGTAVAAICGFIAIKVMIRIVQKAKLSGFAVYVALLGVLVLADQFIFNIFFNRPF